MADNLNQKHNFYSKIGGGGSTSSLPIQTVSKSKKESKAFERTMMERLEHIGLQQVSRNMSLREYRKMYEGGLVHQDFADTAEVTQAVASMGLEELKVPSYIKHFDIIGLIVNQLAGEFDNQKDTIRVDSIDPFSDGEYFREKNTQIRQFTQQYFEMELKKGLLMQGINPEGVEFENEEQKQQYLQYLEAEKAKIITPDKIEGKLKKTFKTTIAEWAELTLEQDFDRFDMQEMDMEELVDYLLTGRYFRHIHVGHDYYKPERWSPEQTFFSEDLEIQYPQDGEYGGRIHFLSPSGVMERYGEKLPENIQKKLYSHDEKKEGDSKLTDRQGIDGFFGAEARIVPYEGYYQRELAVNFQEGLGLPMGKEYRHNEEGEQEARPVWLDDSLKHGNVNHKFANSLRDDIMVRTDLIQVTEAYWKSQKLVGLLTLESKITEEPIQITIDEDILKDYIKENNIKQLRTVSREEAEKNKEIDTIAWFYLPQVWQGKMLSVGGTNLEEDYIFDFKAMDYQIRGNSENYDVKLPISGIITAGLGKKIRTYQVKHNLAMNLIENALEKHIGSFMMFDYNFLASQYKEDGTQDIAEGIEKWREDIRNVGFGFYDSSPQNTSGQNPNASIAQPMRISFVEDIKYYMELAEYYKQKAYEQIGMTPQRMGNPSEYMTTEGIKQGSQASYAQTERIYKKFNTAKRKEREIHLTVAQHSVKDNKDIKVSFTRPDGARVLKKFTDENFWLRKIGVIPVNDSGQRKKLEMFRNMILQNNTMDSDMLDYAKLFTSDSFVSLMEHAEQARERTQSNIQEGRQHEQSLKDKEIQAIQAEADKKLAWQSSENQKDRENNIRAAELNNLGRVGDDNGQDKYLDRISKEADQSIKEEQGNRKLDLQRLEYERKDEKDDEDMKMALRDQMIKLKEIEAKKQISNDKVKVATVNWKQ